MSYHIYIKMQTLSIFALTILGVSALPIPEPVIDDRAGAQAIADAGQALGDKIGYVFLDCNPGALCKISKSYQFILHL